MPIIIITAPRFDSITDYVYLLFSYVLLTFVPAFRPGPLKHRCLSRASMRKFHIFALFTTDHCPKPSVLGCIINAPQAAKSGTIFVKVPIK